MRPRHLQGYGERHFSGGAEASRGQSYWGHWKDDEQEGEGKLKTNEGTSYEGEWKGGTFHGQGTYVFQQSAQFTAGASSTYSGQWAEGKKDGKGKLTLYSGNSYDGEWKADKRHGARTLSAKHGICSQPPTSERTARALAAARVGDVRHRQASAGGAGRVRGRMGARRAYRQGHEQRR